MNKTTMPTREAIKEALDYDADTGFFVWMRALSSRGPVGKRAGYVHKSDGYVVINFKGKKHLAHRLAWLITYGEFPKGMLDHINGDRSDNRMANLRLATYAQNGMNRKTSCNNATGMKGVHVEKKSGSYYAHIRVKGKLMHLGSFSDPSAAHAAYCDAARRYFGEYARFE